MFVRLNPTVATSSCCISCFMDWNGFKRWLNNHGHFTGKTWGNDMKWWACWWISTAFCCQSPMFFVAQITSSWVRWWAAELPLPILRSDGETGKHQVNTRETPGTGIVRGYSTWWILMGHWSSSMVFVCVSKYERIYMNLPIVGSSH